MPVAVIKAGVQYTHNNPNNCLKVCNKIMAGNVIRRVVSAHVCGPLLCVRCFPAVVLGRRIAACVVCSLAALPGAAAIYRAAAAGQVLLYLVATDRRAVLVLDDGVVFSLSLL